MRHAKQVLAVAFFALFAAGVYAADGAGQHRGEFAALDAQLTELDKNHDGRLDDGELRGAARAVIKIDDPRIVTLLGAPNGKITHKELKAFLDTDHDGRVDHGELRRFLISIKTQYPDLYAQIVADDVPIPFEGKRANKATP